MGHVWGKWVAACVVGLLVGMAGCTASTGEGISGCHGNGDCPAAFPFCRADQRCWSTPDPGLDASSDGSRQDGGRDGSVDAFAGIDAAMHDDMGMPGDGGVDAGLDLGMPDIDVGMTGTDTGVHPMDMGMPGTDAAMPGVDSGTRDTGTTLVDAFTPDMGPMCSSTQHLCSGACVSNMSILTCGASCSACSPPANSSATCDGTICGFSCDSGFHACSGACAADDDATACGTSCTTCTVPTNGSAACVGGSCGITCSVGYVPSGSTCSVVPPRPVGPLSTQIVTTRRPVLRWSLPASVTGAHVEVCSDRACTLPIYTGDFTGSSGTLTASLPPGVAFWRLFGTIGATRGTVPSRTWQFTVATPRVPTGAASYGNVPDFEGDGFADVVGRINDFPAPTQVYSGSAGGPSGAPTFVTTAVGNPASADVNGDGFADLVVATDATTMDVYFGSAAGLHTTHDQTFALGRNGVPTSVGDVNGDGYADIVIGNYASYVELHLGQATGLSSMGTMIVPPWSPSAFGRLDAYHTGIAGGDLDGDGDSELVVSDSGYLTNVGRVAVFDGTPTGPSATATVINAPSTYRFGQNVALGDVTGDGYVDLVATTAGSGPAVDHVYIFACSASGVPTTPTFTFAHDSDLADSILVFDLDRDGFADLVYGFGPSPYAGGTPSSTFVRRGSATGFEATPSTTYTVTASLDTWEAPLGFFGDIDHDGYLDFGITHDTDRTRPGTVETWIFRGAATVPTSSSWILLQFSMFAQ